MRFNAAHRPLVASGRRINRGVRAIHRARVMNVVALNTASASGWRPYLVAALGFFAFIPYPALGIGSMSAIQIGNILSILMVGPLLKSRTSRAPLWIGMVLMAPLLTSSIATGVIGAGDLSLAVKELPTYLLAGLTLLVVQFYAPGHALELLTGIAAATVLHAAVGAWQLYAYTNGDFPLFGLYVNQSFLSVQANAWKIAIYTQRPFGIFPEPSAMTSSLAPFVVFFFGIMSGIVRLRREPAQWQRALFATAAFGGLGLMIISRSGHAAVALAAMLPLGLIWLIRSRATGRTFAALVLVFGVLTPLLIGFAGWALSDRIGDRTMGNSSWDERSVSLIMGFDHWMDGGIVRMIIGVGLGGTSPALWNSARIDAVFSVLLTYVYETGFLGVMAVAVVGAQVARIWKAMRFDLCMGAIMVVWLVGLTVTTSYAQLLPLWVALGWLTIWPEVCTLPGQAPATAEAPGEIDLAREEAGRGLRGSAARRWPARVKWGKQGVIQ